MSEVNDLPTKRISAGAFYFDPVGARSHLDRLGRLGYCKCNLEPDIKIRLQCNPTVWLAHQTVSRHPFPIEQEDSWKQLVGLVAPTSSPRAVVLAATLDAVTSAAIESPRALRWLHTNPGPWGRRFTWNVMFEDWTSFTRTLERDLCCPLQQGAMSGCEPTGTRTVDSCIRIAQGSLWNARVRVASCTVDDSSFPRVAVVSIGPIHGLGWSSTLERRLKEPWLLGRWSHPSRGHLPMGPVEGCKWLSTEVAD